MTWKTPESDGGAPIEKYIIEKREKGKGPWMRGAEVSASHNSASVLGLSEGKEYEFRVLAVNKAGPGKPSEVSRGQIAKARFVAPRIDRLSLRPVIVKAGQTIVIDANFIAEPEPTGSWSFETNELKTDDRISSKLAQYNAKLTILNAKRSDTGKYTLKLTNGSGSDQAGCDVTVLCKTFLFLSF